MRLKPEQVSGHLKKNLAAVYLVSGDEPLQHMETCDQIRAAARAQDFSERQVLEVDRSFNWDSLREAAAAMSLFAEKRVIELRFGSGPGVEGAKVLAEYCEQPPADTLLLISAARIDGKAQQSKWFKAIDKAGVTIPIWPVDMARLPDWIVQRAHSRGMKIERDAAELIAQKVEGNLLACAQEIEKLRLLHDAGQTITIETVAAAVTDSTRYDAFELINSAYNGELARALRMLAGLRAEGIEAIAVYGALMWQLRRTCKLARARTSGASEQALFREYRVFDKQHGAFRAVLQRHSAAELEKLLHAAGRIDAQLKSSQQVNSWQSLGWILARLAGYDSLPSFH